MKSLYIHFPFCEAKCHYCDFYSLGKERTKIDDPRLFEEALKIEVQNSGHLLSNQLETIFMGGGTPSMTPYESMARSLEPLWKFTSITPDTEWTMEANPSSIQTSTFKGYRSLGINRVSMGVQAMRQDFLTLLGRVHSKDEVISALDAVFESGFDNVSVDLLCGVPGQSTEDLAAAMEILTRFPITHLSCYLLTLPPHHAMFSQLPNEDIQLEHLLFIDQWMTGAGFEHYEISNFAKPQKRAQHNLNYWTGKSYLGLGPSAHSFDSTQQKRWKNVSSLHKYTQLLGLGKSVITEEEALTASQRELEKWMLALRLKDGFSIQWLTSSLQKNRARLFQEQAILELHPQDPQRLRLTPRGFAVSDQVIRSLVC